MHALHGCGQANGRMNESLMTMGGWDKAPAARLNELLCAGDDLYAAPARMTTLNPPYSTNEAK